MAKLYGSRGTKATQLSKVYLPVDGKAKQINKIYGSVNGQTRLIFNHYTAPPPPPALIETLTYMQDCANYSLSQLKEGMVMEKPYTLIDSRDNTEYTIALLKDGNIWMCENLRIGSNDKSLTISSAQSDMGNSYNLPKGSTTGFSDNNAENLYIDPTYGGYYSWKCATVGSTITSGEAPYSILPRGWRLPTRGDGGEFQTLVNAYGSSGSEKSINLRKTPIPGFVLAGCYYSSSLHGQGSHGFYWSSTASSSNYVYALDLESSAAYYIDNYTKHNGFSVRGICKGNGVLE